MKVAGFPLLYQWRKDGLDITEATTATLSLPLAQPSDAGSYTVVVSNSAGSVTSAPPAVLTVAPPLPTIGGELDSSFRPSLSRPFPGDVPVRLYSVVTQDDGKILIGGFFWTSDGVNERSILARLNSDGSVDPGFQYILLDGPSFWDLVRPIAVQGDGKVIVGGRFVLIHGASRSGLARLNPDGTLDAGFQDGLAGVSGPDDFVSSITLQADRKVLIGSERNDGAPRRGFVRLNADGSLDRGLECAVGSFDATEGLSVRCTAVQGDGRIVIGGEFNIVNGVSRNGLARLNADGTLDNSFQAGLSFGDPDDFSPVIVRSLAVQRDGKILVGGRFDTVNGIPRHSIARLNADGSLDMGFQDGLTGVGHLSTDVNLESCFVCTGVYSLALQSDGKVLMGGVFDTVNGVSRNSVARLNADGTLDSGFAEGLSRIQSSLGTFGSFGSGVYSIALQSDGKLLVGGLFDAVNGVSAVGLVRLWGGEIPPRLTVNIRNGNVLSLNWDARANQTYRVQYKANLSAMNWTDLVCDISGEGGPVTKNDSSFGNAIQRFYRLLLLP